MRMSHNPADIYIYLCEETPMPTLFRLEKQFLPRMPDWQLGLVPPARLRHGRLCPEIVRDGPGKQS
jgi:hypothetical protein